MTLPPHSRKRFGLYEFDAESHELWKGGVRVEISGQPLQVLALLLERPGGLVSREALRQHLWPGKTFVDFEHGMNTAIKRLRAALRDDPERPKYIETVPKHGYRFIFPLEGAGDQAAAADCSGSVTAESPLVSARPGKAPRILQWTTAVVFILFLLAAAFWQLRSTHTSPTQRVMLAVLPFQNLSGDPQQDYFGDGLTEETITELGQLSAEKLGLIARTSAMAYKSSTKTVQQIGNELAVDYIVEGSVRRDAQKVQVSVQLIRVRDQTQFWAHSYDREMHDLLALENELGQAIAGQVQVQLSSQARVHLAKVRTIDAEAHEAYLKGRHFWYQFQAESLNQAIDYYNQALEKDPNYAAAYAGLAAAYIVRANLYGKEDYAKATIAAQRALDLDDSLAEAHEAMAGVLLFHDWAFAAADRELSRSEELTAPSAEYTLRAHWYEARNDTDSAIAVLQRGLRLDPFNPLLSAELGKTYYYARRPDDAITQIQLTRDVDPNFPLANGMLALAYQEKGDLADAASEFRRDNDPVGLAVVQAKQGNLRPAQKALQQLAVNGNNYTMARLSIAVGDKDASITWLKRAYEARDFWLIWLRVDPAYDDLRSDARFQEIERSIGFSE